MAGIYYGYEDIPDDWINQLAKLDYIEELVNDFHLALIYNAADIFVAPSMQENLANTVMESLTCGTPVVAFSIGGMPDMIQHMKNGYLAQPYKIEDLAKGIETVAEFAESRETIRKMAVDKFSEKLIGEAYSKAYAVILQGM